MPAEQEMISLECPSCQGELYQPISWFKQTYFTCPACGAGLAAGQFSVLINDLEQELEARIEELLHGSPHGGCCGGKHHH